MKVNVIKSNLKYPLYSCKFIADDLLLVAGGGGEGNNGIDNKITLLSINDKDNKIKKFRELKLSDDDDSPTCMDYIEVPQHLSNSNSSFDLGDAGIEVEGIFLLGCNENSNKILQTNVNNSLQRFNYENKHIKFVASVDYDKEIGNQRDLNTYMKFLKISENIEFAAICTNRFPSVIRIINPITMNELYEIETGNELRDFDFQLGKDAKILSYITKNTCELISCVTGSFITKSYQFDVTKFTPLKLKFISKDKFFILLKNEVSSKFQLHLFTITGEIKLLKALNINELKFKGITSVDFSNGILAISGNDNSVSFFYLNHTNSNVRLKFLKKFDSLHTFAITKIAFNKTGNKLATVSADNSVSVITIPPNFEKFKPTTKKLFHFIINCIIIAVLAALGKVVVDRDYHIIAHRHWISFNNSTLKPFLNEKAIPYVKEKMKKKNTDDMEYFSFKNSQTRDSDEYTSVTVLSRDLSIDKKYYYSSASVETVTTSSEVPAENRYEEINVDDDDIAINYEDYLASLTLNDIVSITTSGYESKITDVKIQTVPNVEEDVEEILRANYPETTITSDDSSTTDVIQSTPTVENAISKSLETAGKSTNKVDSDSLISAAEEKQNSKKDVVKEVSSESELSLASDYGSKETVSQNESVSEKTTSIDLNDEEEVIVEQDPIYEAQEELLESTTLTDGPPVEEIDFIEAGAQVVDTVVDTEKKDTAIENQEKASIDYPEAETVYDQAEKNVTDEQINDTQTIETVVVSDPEAEIVDEQAANPVVDEEIKVETPIVAEEGVVEEPEVMEDTDVEEPDVVEEGVLEESEVVEETNVEESEVVEETNVEESEVVEKTNVEEPVVVEKTNVEEPDAVAEITFEEPEAVEEITFETPEVLEEITIETPEAVEESSVETPEALEESSVETPEALEESSVETPEAVEESSVEKPVVTEERLVEEPLDSSLLSARYNTTKAEPQDEILTKTKPLERILAEEIEARLPDHVDIHINTVNKTEKAENPNTLKITGYEENAGEATINETSDPYDEQTVNTKLSNNTESCDEKLEELFEENEQIEENIALDEL